MPTTALSFEEIEAAECCEPRAVSVPDWGGTVNVYPLTNAEIEDMEIFSDDNPTGLGYRLKLLQFALRDYTPEQVQRLDDKSGAIVTHLANVAGELSDVREFKARSLGNSDAGPTAGNGSN